MIYLYGIILVLAVKVGLVLMLIAIHKSKPVDRSWEPTKHYNDNHLNN